MRIRPEHMTAHQRIYYLATKRERKPRRWRRKLASVLWLTFCCVAIQSVLWLVLSGLLR
jgi:hypothetical protein